MQKIALLAAALLLVLALPATAAGQGNSAGDQYEENVPGPGGEGGDGGNGGSGSGSGSSGGTNSLPPDTAEDLAEQGADGEAARALAEQTSPQVPGESEDGKADGNDDTGAATSSGGTGDADGGSGVTEVAQAATGTDGGGGTGVLLPVVIGLAALGAVAFLIVRRNSGSPDPA